MLNSVLVIIVGYFLGSILPAYFLGKWIKGIDIRTVGTFNAGVTNVKNILGARPAILTLVFDMLKGIAAIIIAQQIFKTSLVVSYLCGFAAILGHIFPFYIGFHGGQGAATCTGILLFNLYQIFWTGKASLRVGDLVIIIMVIMVMIYVSRTQELLSMTVIPLFCYFLAVRVSISIELITTYIIISYLFLLGLRNIIKFRLFQLKAETYPDFRLWRTLARPAAMAFPILSFFVSRAVLVTLIGSVLALFFFTDLIRILNQRVNKFFLKDIRKAVTIYKDKEAIRISSMTIFLFGCFLSFFLFDRNIAFTAVTFLIFGDMSAKILGLVYGRHKLFNKSLEGSLSHFMACVVLGYILHLYINIPLFLIFAGAAAATLIELVPFNVDDNLSVPVVTGTILTVGIHLVK
jgi:glycerol-3-phosphate acyltransferase PlsY